MQCEYGGEVTFTTREPGYRLRLALLDREMSVILSPADVTKLLDRIREVVAEEDSPD
jgi:uncharacterized protein (DUF169 family)